MKKKIALEPVPQTGHNCKTTAIASVDKYYGEKLGFKPIPLHKKKISAISIRELAKKNGSVQGELLEIRQLPKIFKDIGYETELVDFQYNYPLFRSHIIDNIKAGNLIIASFAVDRFTGNPTTHYDRDNEHAAIINGFSEDLDTIDMVHWDLQRQTTMRNFYDSSMILLNERKPEYYENVKNKTDVSKDKKYDLTPNQNDQALSSPGTKKSIIPAENTGFRGKLIIVKKPKLEQILASRITFLFKAEKKAVDTLLEELKNKTDILIQKGTEGSPTYNLKYKNARDAAERLMSSLTEAADVFFRNNITKNTFNVFENTCRKSVNDAEKVFKIHRGWWHDLHPVLKGILRVLSVFAIPIIYSISKHGYKETFWGAPATDSAEKLQTFKEKLEQSVFKNIETELNIKEKTEAVLAAADSSPSLRG